MQKTTHSFFKLLFLLSVCFLIFYVMVPQIEEKNTPINEFSTEKALNHIKAITQKPHYIGSNGHKEVASYLYGELKKLGLKPEFQNGFTLSDGGILVNSQNIIAKIKGTENGKALLLLSHYDSAPHSKSLGASDDASGVATILESVRAFLVNKQTPKNDIVILFSDAEEIGLNGAALFVKKHRWAKKIGVAINLEARGSSGPGYMLMETNEGNASMVDIFNQSGLSRPNSNSLMYSIYKMLPNDTDLTVFRELGKIQGFNFAFIDNHFNYHTVQDSFENLDKRTLAHQGSNFYPLMIKLANTDLTNLNSTKDSVYFSIPFSFINYPYDWVSPMLIIAVSVFLFLLFLGYSKRIIQPTEIAKGFVTFFGTMVIAGIIGFFGWKLFLQIYPQYNDIQQGFTYNGHDYIYGFICITIAICFLVYHNKSNKTQEYNQIIAPLFFWLIINLGISLKLKGAGFFIIPVFASLIMLACFVITQKSKTIINLLLSVPILIILAPFVIMFPIGLGLKVIFVSTIFVTLLFGLLLPILGTFKNKKAYFGLFFFLSLCFFGKAHYNANYKTNKAKPNSLVYIQKTDQNKAYWATYDKNIDEWTKGYLGEKPATATILNTNKIYSKYKSEFSFMAPAPYKGIKKSIVSIIKDSIIGNQRNFTININPKRKLNRIDVFFNSTKCTDLEANGQKSLNMKSAIGNTRNSNVLTYYVVDTTALHLKFKIPAKSKLELDIKESSFDLLEHPLFSISKRKKEMIPTPFVLNDAVIVEYRIIKNAKN